MPSHTMQRYLKFHLNTQAYVVPVEAVDELVFMAELTCPPCGPSILTGFFNLGGQPVAVIGLRQLFGLAPQAPHVHTPLIVLKTPSPRVALQVDEVCGILRETDAAVIAIEGCFSLNQCATAAVKIDGETALLLDPDRLLLEGERRKLAELEKIERKRLAELQEAAACT